MSTLCMAVPSLIATPVENPLQWDARPGGAVGDFVTKFVKSFFQLEQSEKPFARLQRTLEPRRTGVFSVSAQEGLAHFELPGAGKRREPRSFSLVVSDAAQRALLHIGKGS